MSTTRSLPVSVVGAVNVLAPTANCPYYRLTWCEPTPQPPTCTSSSVASR